LPREPDVVQATRPPKICEDCPTQIHGSRKRCEPCAYQKRLADNLARYHQTSTVRQPRPCARCGDSYTPQNVGRSFYCDACRRAQQLDNQRAHRARNPTVAAPTSRPCPTCGEQIPRNGKVYASFCSDKCKPKCAAPKCDKPSKYKSDVGLLCSRDYMRWKNNGSFLTKWEWEPKPGNCRQCNTKMVAPIKGTGWICSTRCYGRRRLKVDESETWPCVQCGVDIPRRGYRSDAKLCYLCRNSRRPALSALLLAKRGGVACKLCGHAVDMTLSGMSYWGPTADHIIPVSRGGQDIPENLQLAHRICNIRKSDIVTT
jgi:hypothetical protein